MPDFDTFFLNKPKSRVWVVLDIFYSGEEKNMQSFFFWNYRMSATFIPVNTLAI
jgi:hypothetical protein